MIGRAISLYNQILKAVGLVKVGRPIRPIKVPIPAGLQAFDQTNVAYQQRENSMGTSGIDFIDTSERVDAGSESSNIMIWGDNAGKSYATQRPPIKKTALLGAEVNDYSVEVLADSPTFYYRLNESAFDNTEQVSNAGSNTTASSSIQNISSTMNPTDTLITGDGDGAVDNSGSSNLIQFTSSNNEQEYDATNGLTITMVIKPDAASLTSGKTLYASGATDDISIATTSSAFISVNHNGDTLTSSTALTAGTTYHIAYVHTGPITNSDRTLYVTEAGDSLTQEDTANNSTAAASGNTSFKLLNNFAGSVGFEGVLDEVAIFQSALNTTRLNAHIASFNAGAATAGTGIGRGIFRLDSVAEGSYEIAVVGDDVAVTSVSEFGLPLVNPTTVTVTGSFQDGENKVYIDQVSDTAVGILIPAEGTNTGKLYECSISSGAATLTDRSASLPAGIDLAKGFIVLNGRAYVQDKDGKIYNSAEGDLTSWGALDFITAERSYDQGVIIARHHDNIASFGKRTLEFFFDDANPTASPLSSRRDLFYRIGIIGDYAQIEDIIYFIGSSEGGDFGIYKLENFRVTKISDERVNHKIAAMAIANHELVLAGVTIEGRHLVSITQIIEEDPVSGSNTYTINDNYMYDVKYGALYDWSSANTDLDPKIIAATINGSLINHQGESIIFSSLLNNSMEDNPSALPDDDGIPLNGSAITWSVTSPNFTLGTHERKLWRQVGIEGTYGNLTSGSVDIDFSWSDDFFETFTTARTVDWSGRRFYQSGLGSSFGRAFKISSSTKARVYLQNWVLKPVIGTH